MGRGPAGVDFALIGHPEDWGQVRRMMDALRSDGRPPVPDADLRDIFPWIPPRPVERLTVASPDGASARGVYVETFIPPDRLDGGSLRANVRRVKAAVRCAAREGAKVASLGGFTSIVTQGRARMVSDAESLALTTGNTLTAGFIVRGVEEAAARVGLDLSDADLLVIGATGDIGSACTRYFTGKVRGLTLCARREAPLLAQREALAQDGRRGGSDLSSEVRVSTDVQRVLPHADVVIAVASLTGPSLDLGLCRRGTLVCDAGYPKNLTPSSGRDGLHIFHGGMGRAVEGWVNDSAVGDSFYRFPVPGIAHGCMLEGMVLGLEQRYEAYSAGRGHITVERMTQMLEMAERHGIVPAPLFDGTGLWPSDPEPN